MNASTLIWESLVRNNRDVVTTSELSELARRLNKNPRNSIDHLVRTGHLTPLFRGSYYVKDPTEIRLGIPRRSHLELFAAAAKAKGLGRWYFGLYTALRLNGLTHEYRREETVICERLYRIEGVSIGGYRFVVRKWDPKIIRFGVSRKGGLPVSDREKTVLDLAYLDYWSTRRGHTASGEWRTYLDRIDGAKLRRYLERSPKHFCEWVISWI
jgi:predicted transcriptional regulator of viral defense system